MDSLQFTCPHVFLPVRACDVQHTKADLKVMRIFDKGHKAMVMMKNHCVIEEDVEESLVPRQCLSSSAVLPSRSHFLRQSSAGAPSNISWLIKTRRTAGGQVEWFLGSPVWSHPEGGGPVLSQTYSTTIECQFHLVARQWLWSILYLIAALAKWLFSSWRRAESSWMLPACLLHCSTRAWSTMLMSMMVMTMLLPALHPWLPLGSLLSIPRGRLSEPPENPILNPIYRNIWSTSPIHLN